MVWAVMRELTAQPLIMGSTLCPTELTSLLFQSFRLRAPLASSVEFGRPHALLDYQREAAKRATIVISTSVPPIA